MHHPTDRVAHTIAFITPVVEHWLEREIAQWVHPTKDRSDDPSHHEQRLERMGGHFTTSSTLLFHIIQNTQSAKNTLAQRPWLVVFQVGLVTFQKCLNKNKK